LCKEKPDSGKPVTFVANMIPVEVKKRENIAEYIVYMYQTEDLISTFDFNLNNIHEYVIRHMSQDAAEIKSLLLWYADIIDRMKQEKLPAIGRRLSSTQAFVTELSELHSELLVKDEVYQAIYREIEQDLATQIERSEGQVADPVQICLNAVYGKLVINLNGKSLPAEHEKLVVRFGKLLAHLSTEYHRLK
jgi:hypothetical protein